MTVVMERGWKAKVEISPSCPRCGSSNTKFCYYNNYSLTQPRYFCKGCRRYWTKGGSLRNVPVGGGYRRSRRGRANKTLLKQHSIDDSLPSFRTDAPNNIDIAQVYANFLNQKPDSKAEDHLEKPDQMQTVFYPTPEQYLSLFNTLPEELGNITECLHLQQQSTEMYFCGFNYFQKHQEYNGTKNFELPPLPGEEALPSYDNMLWSDSEMMVEHALQATQPPLFDSEARDEEALLMGNWSPFYLSRDASFSRP